MSIIYSETPRSCTSLVMGFLDPIESEKAQIEEAVCGTLEQANQRFHLYDGNHCVVFSYVKEPGVIKNMISKDALASKKNLDRVRKVFAERQFRYCYAPDAHLVKLSDMRTLFIMQKAIGETDSFVAQEMMEQEFERIPTDPEMAEKWKTMTREVAEAVAATGYWDSQMKNFVWDSKLGFGFIDLENVSPDLFLKQVGLSRLAAIFPPEFVDIIYDVAQKEGVTLNVGREVAKVARKQEFEISRERSRWEKQKGFPRIFNKDKWPESSKEREILDAFDRQQNYPAWRGKRPLQTYLLMLPLNRSIPYDKREDIATLEQYKKKRAAFEGALKNLQASGDLLTWKTDENLHQIDLVAYTIYF